MLGARLGGNELWWEYRGVVVVGVYVVDGARGERGRRRHLGAGTLGVSWRGAPLIVFRGRGNTTAAIALITGR